MTKHELLEEIYYQNKSLNRTAQRISLIGLLGIISRMRKECVEKNDETGKKITRCLLILVAIGNILLGIDSILDIIKRMRGED